MCCALRPSRKRNRIVAAIALAAFLTLTPWAALSSTSAAAQSPSPSPSPTPSASLTPVPTTINSDLSSGSAVLNLGSNFLERLGNQATSGFGGALRSNPAGGGASEATEGPRYRTWGELYGISTTIGTQGDFVGDKRRTVGGVAGFGARVAPGVNVGFSVDQSHTTVDVPLALQSATLDLTQIGFNASVDKGPWTWAVAVEEAGGGLDPVAASGAMLQRARLLAGAEIGHYWIVDQKVLDLSAYGKFVDNFSQDFSSVVVSLGEQSITVQGIGESQYGADAGASASLSLTNTARLYVNYDAKFRAALQSHQGTLGVEFRW